MSQAISIHSRYTGRVLSGRGAQQAPWKSGKSRILQADGCGSTPALHPPAMGLQQVTAISVGLFPICKIGKEADDRVGRTQWPEEGG